MAGKAVRVIMGGGFMSTQAELIKDSMQRIRRLEFALAAEPESKAIKELIDEEKQVLEKIEKAN